MSGTRLKLSYWYPIFLDERLCKNSAVAEMGDRLATAHNRHEPKVGELLCPFRWGAGSPCLPGAYTGCGCTSS